MDMKKLIFVLMLGILGSGAALAQEYVPTPVTVSKEKVRMNGKTYLSHVVLERQTLFSIAKAYGVSVTDIDQANPALKLMSEGLKKNQILLIPLVDSSTASSDTGSTHAPEAEPEPEPVNPDDYFFHIVKWFEDLDAIARQYNVPKDLLMRFNGMTSDKVKKRQKIKIPSHPDFLTLPKTEEPAAPVEEAEVPPTPADTTRRDTTSAFSWFSRLIKNKNNISVALLLPFNTTGQINENYVDFYSGTLMAVRDLGDRGLHIDLNVYDAADGKQPLTADRIAASDVIIGPVDTLDLVRTLTAAPNRFVVSPLDPKGVELVEDYRNLIHAPTSAEWQYAELINWLADEKQAEDRIILVTEKGVSPTAAASYLKESGLPYSTLSYGILEGRNIVETLNGMMTKEGVNRVVNAFISGGKDEMRNTLVHVYNVLQADYLRMAEHNIHVAASLLWHYNDTEFQEALLEILPAGLNDKGYPLKSFFDYGINVSSHTDFPATSDAPDDPFGIMEIAVTGVYQQEPGKPWWPEELLTREQALTALTINVARQMFLENERGSICTGKYADFLLLNQDVLTCPADQIHATEPVATYFEGTKVYPM